MHLQKFNDNASIYNFIAVKNQSNLVEYSGKI